MNNHVVKVKTKQNKVICIGPIELVYINAKEEEKKVLFAFSHYTALDS